MQNTTGSSLTCVGNYKRGLREAKPNLLIPTMMTSRP